LNTALQVIIQSVLFSTVDSLMKI